MIIPATKLVRDYKSVSKTAHETQEVIHVTTNGSSDLVVMSAEAYEKREQEFKLRETLFTRLNNKGKTYSIEEARKMLKENLNG